MKDVAVLKRWKGLTWLVILVLLFCFSTGVYAKNNVLPDEVQVVKNEKEMLCCLLNGMKNHKSQFSFYYSGIERDLKKYRKESPAYKSLIERIAKETGYIAGMLSGYCITVCGDEQEFINIQFSYSITKKQERRVDKEVKKIVKKIGNCTDALKVKRAHDYLIRHMSYDERYYTSYHAFVKGRGVCMAYALAYQRLLQEMEIPCIYVKGENHAWNMVKIGKYWYNVDVTWDDQSKNKYAYFLKSDSEFMGHKKRNNKEFNVKNKAKYSYDLNKIR